MIFRTKTELLKHIRECLQENSNQTLPSRVFICEEMGFPTYEISISKSDEDVYVDQNGYKWVKIKEQPSSLE